MTPTPREAAAAPRAGREEDVATGASSPRLRPLRRRQCSSTARHGCDLARPHLVTASFSSSPTRIGRSPFLASVPVPVCCRRHADEPSVESHSTPSYLFRLQGPNAPRSTLQTAVVCPRGVAPLPWPRHGLAMAMPGVHARGSHPRPHLLAPWHAHVEPEPRHTPLDTNTAMPLRLRQDEPFRAFHQALTARTPTQPARAHDRTLLSTIT